MYWRGAVVTGVGWDFLGMTCFSVTCELGVSVIARLRGARSSFACGRLAMSIFPPGFCDMCSSRKPDKPPPAELDPEPAPVRQSFFTRQSTTYIDPSKSKATHEPAHEPAQAPAALSRANTLYRSDMRSAVNVAPQRGWAAVAKPVAVADDEQHEGSAPPPAAATPKRRARASLGTDEPV